MIIKSILGENRYCYFFVAIFLLTALMSSLSAKADENKKTYEYKYLVSKDNCKQLCESLAETNSAKVELPMTVVDVDNNESTQQIPWTVTIERPAAHWAESPGFTVDIYGDPVICFGYSTELENRTIKSVTFSTDEFKGKTIESFNFQCRTDNSNLNILVQYGSSSDKEYDIYYPNNMQLVERTLDIETPFIVEDTLTITFEPDNDGNPTYDNFYLFVLSITASEESGTTPIEPTIPELKLPSTLGGEKTNAVEWNKEITFGDGNEQFIPKELLEDVNGELGDLTMTVTPEFDVVSSETVAVEETAEDGAYTETDNSNFIGDNGELIIHAPCSGRYRVTLNFVSKSSEYADASVSKVYDFYPSIKNATLNGVQIQGEGLEGSVTLEGDENLQNALLVYPNVIGAEYYFNVTGTQSIQAFAGEENNTTNSEETENQFFSIPEGFTKYENANLDLSTGKTLTVHLVKNKAVSPAHIINYTVDVETEIDEIISSEEEETYYTVSGIRVKSNYLQPGVYLKRSAKGVEKIVIK